MKGNTLRKSTSLKDKGKEGEESDADKIVSLLPSHVKFMPSGDSFYPVEFEGVIYDSFNLRVS